MSKEKIFILITTRLLTCYFQSITQIIFFYFHGMIVIELINVKCRVMASRTPNTRNRLSKCCTWKLPFSSVVSTAFQAHFKHFKLKASISHVMLWLTLDRIQAEIHFTDDYMMVMSRGANGKLIWVSNHGSHI